MNIKNKGEIMFKSKTTPSTKIAIVFEKQGKTKESFRDECDINNILRRFRDKGQVPTNVKTNPVYLDTSNIGDYQQSLNVVIKAKESFDSLPAKVKERFHNDPWSFLNFASDARNIQEMVSLGLAVQAAPQGDTVKTAENAPAATEKVAK